MVGYDMRILRTKCETLLLFFFCLFCLFCFVYASCSSSLPLLPPPSTPRSRLKESHPSLSPLLSCWVVSLLQASSIWNVWLVCTDKVHLHVKHSALSDLQNYRTQCVLEISFENHPTRRERERGVSAQKRGSVSNT